jgi:kinesin family protein 5
MEALKVSAKDAAAVDKERRKAEKMAAMMAKFDAVSLPLRPSRSVPSIGAQLTLGNNSQEGTLSEKEDAIRVMLAKLNAVDPEDPTTALSQEDITLLYRQLSERQALLREANEKLRQTQEESEGVSRRREEVEQRLESLETENEELLGRFGPISASVFTADRELLSMGSAERTIKEEEASSADVAQSIEELKVRRWSLERWLGDLLTLAPTRTGQARGSVRCQARHPAERDLGSQASAGTPGAGAEESGDDGREP